MATTKRNKNTPDPTTTVDEAAADRESVKPEAEDADRQAAESGAESAAPESNSEAPAPDQPDEQEQDETPAEPEPLSPQQENEQLKARIEELTNLHLRAVADLDNYRKRARRELVEALRYACGDLMTDLLPVLDNFERALQSDTENTDAAGLRQGVELILKQLTDTLAKHGLAPVPALHEPFDPSRHEALGQVETETVEPGLVAQEVRRGYQLHDRVLRASQVFVATAPAPPADQEEPTEETGADEPAVEASPADGSEPSSEETGQEPAISPEGADESDDEEPEEEATAPAQE